MDSRDFAKFTQARVWSELEPLEYRKLKPSRFSRTAEDVLLFVDLQKGKYTTRECLEITVNLGVLSLPLNRLLGDDYHKPDIDLCNWRARIGHYMPENVDKWWEIRSNEQATVVAEEIAQALTTFGLPVMDGLSSTAKLYTLWRAGPGGWLSEFVREKYLCLLEQHWIKKTDSDRA